MKLWLPLEQVKLRLNYELTLDKFDQEVRKYILQVQDLIEQVTNRNLDGEILREEYYDGGFDYLGLQSFPVQSITSLKIATDRNFDGATAEDSSGYFTTEEGFLYLRDEVFPEGDNVVQLIYKGGFIPLVEVVAAAVPAASMTIAEDLESFDDTFSVYIITDGTDTAGSITITGLDENGDSVSDVVTPKSEDLTEGNKSYSISTQRFSKITAVNSSGVGEEGTVQILASSFPMDLQLAVEYLVNHFAKQDQNETQGVESFSTSGRSVSGLAQDLPKEALAILHKYRSYH